MTPKNPERVKSSWVCCTARAVGLGEEAGWMVHDRYMLSYDDLSNRSCCHPLRFPVRNLR
jgi:hypothetical protein